MPRKKPDSRTQAFESDEQSSNRPATVPLTTITCWRCWDCGQIQFVAADEKPSGYCPYCKDMRTWEKHDS
ncbi:MAG: hypothetical protein ACPG7F_01270 [Aggregatilineales bacterium]